jgi:hypothetical protein
MENFKLICLIYELKGMVKTLSDLADHDENYQIPMIENIEDKMKDIMQEIELKSA